MKQINLQDTHMKQDTETPQQEVVMLPGDLPVLPQGNNPINKEKLSPENQEKYKNLIKGLH